MRAQIARLVLIAAMLASATLLTGAAPNTRPAAAPRAGANGPATVAMDWQDELVDKLGLVGQGSSIALDSLGHPHIAYYDFTQHGLKYAAWDGVAWTLDTVERDLGSIDAPSHYSPVRSGIGYYGGSAYIVYQKFDALTGAHYLRYALGGPGGWTISTIGPVDAQTFEYAPSLRLDPNHNLHLSYTLRDPLLQSLQTNVIYARFDFTGTSWLIQPVTGPLCCDDAIVTSLALGPANQPEIAYGDNGSFVEPAPLRLARWNAGSWLTQTVTLTGSMPSLAVDQAGNPHLAYVDRGGFPFNKVGYATLTGTTWLTQTPALCRCRSAPSIALDGLDRPHIAIDNLGLEVLAWDGATWQTSSVPQDANYPQEPMLALDSAGNTHLSYFDAQYEDLHHVAWGPNWNLQTVALSGDEAHLAIDVRNRPYISYSTNPPPDFYHVQLANWTPGGYWQYREALPFTAGDHSMRLEYDANHQPLPIISYTDLRDLAHPHLGFAQWNGSSFVTQTVDGSNDVGFSSSLAFDNQADPVIGYLDLNGAHPHIRLAVSSNNGQTWGIYTDTAAPTLGTNSGLRALATSGSLFCCRIYIAYYETSSKALRLATWNSGQWTDEIIDAGSGDIAGLFVSLAVDRTTGKPAMAYLDATHGDVRYAFWRGAWLTTTVDSGVQSVSDLSLSLALYSDQYPRIAYTARVDKSLRLAWTTVPTSTWTIETVTTFNTDPSATFPPTRVSSQAQERDHIAFSQPAAGVVYAFRSATLPYSLYFNPLQPCLDPQPPDASTLGGTLAQVRAMAPSALAQVDDLTSLRALRDLFELSPVGQHYIDLYYQYSHETGALALANPALLWDAYRTLENFVPGFAALAAGRGDSIVITQTMVDQANNIADRLVTAGSPALGAAIDTERSKYNHLQDFAGKTFAEAAKLMGVAAYGVYLPLVRR